MICYQSVRNCTRRKVSKKSAFHVGFADSTWGFSKLHVSNLQTRHVKFEKLTGVELKLFVWIWWKHHVEKCAISGQNGLFCHQQIAKWRMEVKSRKHGAISNALWQRQVQNRPPFKVIFLLGGKNKVGGKRSDPDAFRKKSPVSKSVEMLSFCQSAWMALQIANARNKSHKFHSLTRVRRISIWQLIPSNSR